MSTTLAKPHKNGKPKGRVTSEILDRPPPADLQAERGVLGSVLIKPDAMADLSTLSPRDFHDEANAKLFAHMQAIDAAGQKVDLTLLMSRLAPEEFEAVGGAGYLAKLSRSVPHAANAVHYASIVREKARLRRFIRGASETLRQAYCELPSADVEAYWQGVLEDAGPTGVEFERLTSADLNACNEEIEYLIDDILPARQGGIISAVFKSLKTGVAADAIVSLATGTPFLGYFPVRRAVRCGIMSAESGRSTLKHRAREIAASKGFSLDEVTNAIWSTSCPRLTRADHLAALKRFIVRDRLEVLKIDPTYLAMSGIGESAKNVFSMGDVLAPLTELIQQTGCSIILVNHNRKDRPKSAREFDPPKLSEISMSGFAEWARFWILLGPRQTWDQEQRRHWLHLVAGGSSGHAGSYHVDVSEGRHSDPDGRRWEVSATPASEAQRQTEQAQEAAKATAERKTIDDDKAAIVAAGAKMLTGATKTDLRERSELRGPRFNRAFNELLDEAVFEEVEVTKGNNRPYPGFRLRRDEN